VHISEIFCNFYAKSAAPNSNLAENPWCLSCEFEKYYDSYRIKGVNFSVKNIENF
jgi:hypothetical protein